MMFSGNDAADHPQHGLNRQRPRVAARPSRVMREANADGSPMWRSVGHVLLGGGGSVPEIPCINLEPKRRRALKSLATELAYG